MRSNGLYVLKNSFGDPCPLWKYDLLENKIHLGYCIIYYTWMLFLCVHSTIVFLSSLTLIILIEKNCNFVYYYFQKKKCEGKYIVSWNIQEYFILHMINSNFINYTTNTCWVFFVLHQSRLFK
jgi:hypothetical protein